MALGNPQMGVNGEVALWNTTGSSAVIALEMVSWSLEMSSDVIETAPFNNSGWNRVVGQANRKWTATFEGSKDVTATSGSEGQNDLRDAFVDGTVLNVAGDNSLRLYTDYTNTTYWTPDATDGECYITAYSESAAAADAIKVTFTATGSGEIDYHTA